MPGAPRPDTIATKIADKVLNGEARGGKTKKERADQTSVRPELVPAK